MDPRALRLVPAAAAAWVAAAVTTLIPSAAVTVAALLWAGVVLAAVAAFASRAARAPRGGTGRVRAALAIVAVALAFAAASASVVALADPAREAAGRASTDRALVVEVIVTGKVERTSAGYRADAVAERIHAGERMLPAGVPVTLLLDDLAPGLDVGTRMRADATAFPADPGERAVLVVRIRTEGAVVRPPAGVLAATSWLRGALTAAAATLPQPGGGLVPGLAVGDTLGVEDAVDDAMKTASLSHLTAVSGANCAIVVGLAFLLAAACGARRGVRVAVGAASLGGFVLLVTPEPSVVRAATMAGVAMLALLLGRRGAGLAVLALAAGLLLVLDPWLSLSLGFALSVGATAALLVLAPPLARGLARFLPRVVAMGLAVPLAAQIVCGPLIVLISPGVPVYGVVANLLAAPAAPAATVLGLAACLAAPLPWLQAGLVALAWVPSAWIAATAELVAGLPAPSLPWPADLPGVLSLGAAGAALTVALLPPGRRRIARLLRGAGIVAVTIGAGVAAGSVAIAAIVVPLTTPQDWRIAMCDVGQGDAVLVRSAGRAMLVDTGPEPRATAACLDRLGIARIDVLVLTHFDLDHVGGLDALAGRAHLVLHGPLGDAHDERDRVDLRAAEVVEAHAGMAGTVGAATWRILWPAPSGIPPGNDASVVLEVSGSDVPRTVLLGDLGADAQRALLASGTLHPPYRVVKFAHHGSADQDGALYDAIGADLALIPVGVDNDYGHPRDDALALLAGDGTTAARTDRDGLVLVGLADDGVRLTVWRERGPPGVGGAR